MRENDDTLHDDAPLAPVPRRRALPWLLFLLAAVLGVAWFYYEIFVPIQDELVQTRSALREAHLIADGRASEIAILNEQLGNLNASKADLAAQVSQRDKELNELVGAQEELQEKLYSQIAEGDVAIRQSQGQLVVDLVDKILFPSGEADLSDSGRKVLRQVGEIFLKVPDKVIQVGGHTDDVPISAKLKERFPTNWELSAARALNVVRFLEDEVQVPGARLVAAGFSQHRPIGPNTTKNGRRKNRRIEVVLLPSTALRVGNK